MLILLTQVFNWLAPFYGYQSLVLQYVKRAYGFPNFYGYLQMKYLVRGMAIFCTAFFTLVLLSTYSEI